MVCFKSGFALLAIFSLVPTLAGASEIDAADALPVAAVQAQIMNTRSGYRQAYTLQKSDPQPIETGGRTLAYVFELEPEGFVVVTTDTRLSPVIAYSEYGSFAMAHENPLLDVLKGDISRRIGALELGLVPQERIEAYRSKWASYMSGDVSALAAGESWPPAGQTSSGGWIESAWTQGSPFNDSCPMDPVTEARCLAGCPAVTMGQIINFWQYPDSVIFTNEDSYTSVYDGRTIPIDAPAASIPFIDYSNGDPSGGVCADIAYACGVSTQSVYTSKVSGVFTNSWCAHGLTEHFAFSSAEFREGDGGDFYEVLEQNMKDSMPAIIVIVGDIGGHTLVCDGFREGEESGDPEWHLNFGWGLYQPRALSMCWYVIPDSLPMGLTTLVEAVVNIEAPRRPQPVSAGEKEPITLASLRCEPLVSRNSSVIGYSLPQDGIVEIGIWDASGSKVRSLVNEFRTEGSHCISWNGEDEKGRALPAGVYFVRLAGPGPSLTSKLILVR